MLGLSLKSAQMEDWVQPFLHPSVVYGPGGDPQVVAAMVLQSYAECGYIATLDFTKCFDFLRPEATAAILQNHGF